MNVTTTGTNVKQAVAGVGIAAIGLLGLSATWTPVSAAEPEPGRTATETPMMQDGDASMTDAEDMAEMMRTCREMMDMMGGGMNNMMNGRGMDNMMGGPAMGNGMNGRGTAGDDA